MFIILILMVTEGAGRQLYWILIHILLTCIVNFWGLKLERIIMQ